jgi:hypothetical protein
MTGALAIGGPFVTAAAAVTLRHRFGAWASWLCILLAGFLQARYLASPPWWTTPDFLAGLDEAVSLLAAAIAMALIVHQFGTSWPSRPVQVVVTAFLGLLIAWGNARLHSDARAINTFLAAALVWLAALLGRDWHHRQRRRHSRRNEA